MEQADSDGLKKLHAEKWLLSVDEKGSRKIKKMEVVNYEIEIDGVS